jgi:hypothetical protein
MPLSCQFGDCLELASAEVFDAQACPEKRCPGANLQIESPAQGSVVDVTKPLQFRVSWAGVDVRQEDGIQFHLHLKSKTILYLNIRDAHGFGQQVDEDGALFGWASYTMEPGSPQLFSIEAHYGLWVDLTLRCRNSSDGGRACRQIPETVVWVLSTANVSSLLISPRDRHVFSLQRPAQVTLLRVLNVGMPLTVLESTCHTVTIAKHTSEGDTLVLRMSEVCHTTDLRLPLVAGSYSVRITGGGLNVTSRFTVVGSQSLGLEGLTVLHDCQHRGLEHVWESWRDAFGFNLYGPQDAPAKTPHDVYLVKTTHAENALMHFQSARYLIGQFEDDAYRRAFLNERYGESANLQPYVRMKPAFQLMAFIWRHVDVFVCSYVASDCEFFMPFNKSILIHIANPIPVSREHPVLWENLLENIARIKSQPHNLVVAASTHYFQHYLRYFQSSLVDIPYWPLIDMQLNAAYAPALAEVLWGRNKDQPAACLLAELRRVAAEHGCPFLISNILDIHYGSLHELGRYHAVVVVPYQSSTCAWVEYYQLGLPLFVPSLALWQKWNRRFCLQRGILVYVA